MTLDAILWDAAVRTPERPALLDGDEAIDFAQLAERVRTAAALLRDEHGIGRGDRVALLLGNSTRFVEFHYGALALGAVVVPLNPALGDEATREALELAQPACVVTAAGIEPRTAGAFSGGVDDPAILFMTSGTTGRPKGILVSHEQALIGLDAWAERWNYGERTISLMIAPFFHVVYNPLILGAHRRRGAAVVVTALSSRTAAREAERRRATALMGTPSLFIQLLQDRTALARDLSSVDTLIYGAAPTPVPVVNELRRRFPDSALFNCYGLTETCSALSCLGPEHLEGHEDSVGLPHPGVEISVRDGGMRELGPGETGEVCCRGPNVIGAYHGAPEANAERFHDGWLRTGDIGHRDADGFLYLIGRADDRINVSGEKVYPATIENVLYRHPAVGDAVAIPASDASKGQVVKALVVLKDGAAPDAAEIRRYCLKHLPSIFAPRIIEFVAALPRNPSGKILRRELS